MSGSRIVGRGSWQAYAARGAVPLCALAVVSLLVLNTSRAAFTGETDNPGNAWAAGAVDLSDNDSGSAMFTASLMVPGDVVSNSIVVTNDSTVASVDVRLYGEAISGDLAPYLNVDIGTTVGGTQVFTGTLDDFATAHTEFSNGADTWDGVAPEATRTYYFKVELDPAAPDTAEGDSAAATFVWEAQSNPTMS